MKTLVVTAKEAAPTTSNATLENIMAVATTTGATAMGCARENSISHIRPAYANFFTGPSHASPIAHIERLGFPLVRKPKSFISVSE